MPIEVYTGKPGNGKTAFMMERLMKEAEKAERPIWAGGIDGLQPGLASVLDDPKQWNAVKPNEPGTCNCTAGPPGHEHVVPDGSLIFIDEAWKWFGHLHDASRQATPHHVLQLAEHRHRGIDFIWTTQGPGQIYPFARPLIANHHHHVRKFGTSFVDVYEWQELQEDTKSEAKRELSMKSTKALPAKVFGLYKSAEVHTIKRRLPLRVYALVALPLLFAPLAWYGYSKLRPDAYAETLGIQQGTSSPLGEPAPGATVAANPPGQKAPRFATTADYVKQHEPRIAALPWSAPAYDDRRVTADPQLFCASAEAGEDANGERRDASCTCLTEQGTPYALPANECRMLAKQGMPYNPYKERTRDNGAARTAQGGGKAPTVTPSPGSVITGEQLSGYGDIGYGASESAPR